MGTGDNKSTTTDAEEAEALKSMHEDATDAFASTRLGLFFAEAESQLSPKYISTSFFNLMWIFITASIVGLFFEDAFHAILYGNWESRAGFVWGPLSPIYGVGALLLTLFLNRLYYSHNIIVFIAAMIVGSCIEYFTSLGMEWLWGAAAWDYTGTIGSIDGRTNLLFGMIWGTLGLIWVRIFMPLYKWMFGRITDRTVLAKVLTATISVFLALDVTATIMALNRDAARVEGIPAANAVDVQLDEHFPDEWMQARFHNMTVYGKQQDAT